MTRSYRKTPVFNMCGGRANWYKRVRNKQIRAQVRNMIAHEDWDKLEIFDPPWDWWDDPRDGKGYYQNFYPSWGYGVHFPQKRWKNWSKKEDDIAYAKAMRK